MNILALVLLIAQTDTGSAAVSDSIARSTPDSTYEYSSVSGKNSRTCNDSVYWDLKSVVPSGLSQKERDYVKYFEENCTIDTTSRFREMFGLTYVDSTRNRVCVSPERTMFQANYLKSADVKGIGLSVYDYKINPSSPVSLVRIFELALQDSRASTGRADARGQTIYDYESSIRMGFACGFIVNPEKPLSFVADLRIPIGTVFGNNGFLFGIGSNQELFLKIGRANKLAAGIGLSEMIQVSEYTSYIFGINFSMGFETNGAW